MQQEGKRKAKEVARKLDYANVGSKHSCSWEIRDLGSDLKSISGANSDSVHFTLQSRISKAEKSDFVTLIVPKKVIESSIVASTLDRLGLSDNYVVAVIAAVIQSANGNIDDFVLLRQTTRRAHMANRTKIAMEVIDHMVKNPPEFGAIHWDGKLIADIMGRKT